MIISLFQDDPNYIPSEDLDVEEQLKMGYAANEVPFEGAHPHKQTKQERHKRGAVNSEAPQSLVMERGAGPETSEVTRGGKNASRPRSHEYNLRSRESDTNPQANMVTDHESVENKVRSQQMKRPDYISHQLSDEAKGPSGYQRHQEQMPLRAGAPQGQIPSQLPPQQFQGDFQLHPHDPAPLPSPIQKQLSPVKSSTGPSQPSIGYFPNEGGPGRSAPHHAHHAANEQFLMEGHRSAPLSKYEGGPGRSAPHRARLAASEQSSMEGHHVSAPSHARSYYHEEGGPGRSAPQPATYPMKEGQVNAPFQPSKKEYYREEGGPGRSAPQPAAYPTKESRSNAPSQISNGVEGRPGRSAPQPNDGHSNAPSQPSNEYYPGEGGPGRSAPQYRQHEQISREGHASQQPPSHDRQLQREWHTDEYGNTQQPPFPVEQSRHASDISHDHFSRGAGTWKQEGQHGIYAGGSAGLLRDSLHPDTNAPSKDASFPLRTDDATNQSFGTQSSLGFDNASPHNSTSTTQTSTEGSLATQTPAKKEPASSVKKGKLPSSKKVADDIPENRLVNDIDQQIEVMAAEVQVEVGKENEHMVTRLHKPFDPNLVCPMCGKEHRIGEIQKFRVHVDQCEG
jgi:hypothetical protein